MKLSELMKGITPSADFAGFVMADDMVLAIDVSETQDAAVEDYAVLQMGIEGVDPSLNSETSEKNYLRAGKSTTKTGTQRTFSISGDMYKGDEAQDKLLSHAMKYATGQKAIVNYVYFNMLTGEGEKGKASVAVNKDGGGNGGENATIDIELSKSGSAPTEFVWGISAELSSIDIGALELSPEFSGSVKSYTAATTNESDIITVRAVADNAVVSIKVGETVVENGAAATWSSGENTVKIKVTNGTESSEYTVVVTKS